MFKPSKRVDSIWTHVNRGKDRQAYVKKYKKNVIRHNKVPLIDEKENNTKDLVKTSNVN